MKATHKLQYKNNELTIIGKFCIGSLGNCEDLPEPRRFEIKTIYVNGFDVTNIIEKDDMDEIEVLLLEENYDF